jgi:hypothetical protein
MKWMSSEEVLRCESKIGAVVGSSFSLTFRKCQGGIELLSHYSGCSRDTPWELHLVTIRTT